MRERGTCSKWVGSFGFITTDRGDLFVSFRAIEADGFRALREGQSVTFARGLDPSGRPCAVAVRLECADGNR
jgi:cold shock protein